MTDLYEAISRNEFDYGLLKSALAEYRQPRVKIHDLLKKRDIIRVKKGLYVFGERLSRGPYSREVLANLIYGPSYISLEYALAFHGLIPERVEALTSVTNKRKKSFRTPLGLFSYRYIHPSLYPVQITLNQTDSGQAFLMAGPEKALFDMVYFQKRMPDSRETRRYLEEDLRMDPVDLERMNRGRIRELADVYGPKGKILARALEGKR